jgi:hypothetical protein
VSATLSNCIFERGGVINELPNASISDCQFNRSGTNGLLSTAGTGAITNCTATNDRFGGLVLGARNATNCTVTGIRQGGITTTGSLTNCVASGVWGDGLTANGMTSCSATTGKARGLVSTGAISQAVARGNSGIGVLCTGGTVTSVTSELNGGVGLSVTGASVSNSSANQNGGGGIQTNASTIQNCTVRDNTGVGVTGSGSSTLTGSVVRGSSGAAVSGVSTVQNCTIEGNGSGLSGATTVAGSYVGNNGGLGGAVSGGAVSNSTVVGNATAGVSGATSVSNSWVVGNSGVGVDGSNTTVVTSSTVSANAGGGVKNLGLNGIQNSNLNGNTGTDAFDNQTRSGTGDVKNFTNNYWGTSATAVLNLPANAFAAGKDIDPWIQDGSDGALGWYLNYTPVRTSAVANAPDAQAPAFLVSVTPNVSVNPGVGLTTFTLVFSKAMNTGVNPVVTFGVSAPYTLWTVNAIGWVSSTTWQGSFNMQTTTGNGLNTIRVAGARDAGGFVIPDDVRNKFILSAGLGAYNGIIIVPSGAKISLDWSGETPPVPILGYNVKRAVVGTSDFVLLNTSGMLSPATKTFDDTAVVGGTKYSYVVSYRTTDNQDKDWLQTGEILAASSGVGNWSLY